MIESILVILGAWLLGGLPMGAWLARARGGTDPTRAGSGSGGATNTGRLLGWRWGLLAGLLMVSLSQAAEEEQTGPRVGINGVEVEVMPIITRWRPEARRGFKVLSRPTALCRRIEVRPRGAWRIKGRLAGLVSLPDSVYTLHLAAWRTKRPAAEDWPEQGAELRVATSRYWQRTDSTATTGRFAGFRGHCILLDVELERHVLPLLPGRSRVTGPHGGLETGWLTEPDAAQWPPARERLLIRTRRGLRNVNPDDLRHLDLRRPWEGAEELGWWVGCLAVCALAFYGSDWDVSFDGILGGSVNPGTE